MYRVSVIIVSYQSASTIGSALAELRTAAVAGWLQVIVVDNASTDGTAALLRDHHPWVELIENPDNRGFGRANNQGLARAQGEFILFLNPDAVIGTGPLRRLVRFLQQHPEAAFVGPALENAGGTPYRPQRFPTPRRLLAAALGRPDPGYSVQPGDAPRQVSWLCGAVLLGRKSVLKQLGGFDARFFLYFEETDLCYRAACLGLETWVLAEASAHHELHHSARGTNAALHHGCIAQHYFESRYYYLVKHYGRLQAMVVEIGERAVTLVRAIVRRLRRRSRDDLLVVLRAPMLRAPRDVVESTPPR